MNKKKVLYISGSLGLGHIIRDLEIVKELRKINKDIDVSWLAANPASDLIIQSGEKLLPEAQFYANDNVPAENAAKEGFRLNLLEYLMKAIGEWKQNVEIFKKVMSKERFDIVVADEAYEIAIALANKDVVIDMPFIMLYDFIGNDSMTWNPMDKLAIYMWNREWAKCRNFFNNDQYTAIFVGELEDVPDIGLGPFLPKRRELAKKICQFVGYILPFDPITYKDKEKIRGHLGYSEAPLVICSIGGTAVGKDLLALCGQTYDVVKRDIADLKMILVCGPRLASEELIVPAGVEVEGYIPNLYEHFAACDLAIVQAGGTTTLELTALKKQFLYFPLDGHFEQQVHVTGRLARHKAGIKMKFAQTTPESLAKMIVSTIGEKVTYPSIPTDGAVRAARVINNHI